MANKKDAPLLAWAKEWLGLSILLILLGTVAKSFLDSLGSTFLSVLLEDKPVSESTQWAVSGVRLIFGWIFPISISVFAIAAFYVKGYKQGRIDRRLMLAMRNMDVLHGHVDEDGLLEAKDSGQSFNLEPCWRCGYPRFQQPPNGDKRT